MDHNYQLPFIIEKINIENYLNIKHRLQTEINIYVYENNEIVPYHVPSICKYSGCINVLIPKDNISSKNWLFRLIPDNYLTSPKSSNGATYKKVYTCSSSVKDCKYTSNKKANMSKHERKCERISVQKIVTVQKCYGKNKSVIEQLMKYLPEEAINFRQSNFCCFDIESLGINTENQSQVNFLEEHSEHSCVSIVRVDY